MYCRGRVATPRSVAVGRTFSCRISRRHGDQELNESKERRKMKVETKSGLWEVVQENGEKDGQQTGHPDSLTNAKDPLPDIGS